MTLTITTLCHYAVSLCWVSLCWVSLCWVSLCWVSLCWVSLCWVSSWWVLWPQKMVWERIHKISYDHLTIILRSSKDHHLQSTYNQLTINLQSTYNQLTINLQSTYNQLMIILWSFCSCCEIILWSSYNCLKINLWSIGNESTINEMPSGSIYFGLNASPFDYYLKKQLVLKTQQLKPELILPSLVRWRLFIFAARYPSYKYITWNIKTSVQIRLTWAIPLKHFTVVIYEFS
jgi:hypothetical protein